MDDDEPDLDIKLDQFGDSTSQQRELSPTIFLPESKVPANIKKSSETWEDGISFDNEGITDNLGKLLDAAEHGRVSEVKELLEKYPRLHEGCDADGYSALHRASYEGHVDVAKVLLTYGANVMATTHDGWHPLHSACRWGQVEAASLLLQNGANINALTNGKQTPLHLAALGIGGTATLKLLLFNRRLDATILNTQGETARDIANRSGKWVDLFEAVEESMNVQ